MKSEISASNLSFLLVATNFKARYSRYCKTGSSRTINTYHQVVPIWRSKDDSMLCRLP